MRIDSFWVVTEPAAVSTLRDICFAATLRELRLHILAGLNVENTALFTDEDEAVEEAKHRLLGHRVVARIREQQDLPADEVVRVTLHDEDGNVLYRGDIR